MGTEDRRNVIVAVIVGLVGGAGIALATMAGPQVFPHAPHGVWVLCLLIGAFLIAGTIWFLFYEYVWRPRRPGEPPPPLGMTLPVPTRFAIGGSIAAALTLLLTATNLYFERPAGDLRPTEQIPPQRTTPSEMPPRLLFSLFMTDYNNTTGAFAGVDAMGINENGNPIGEVFFRVNYDKGSHSKFVLIYIPASDNTVKLALSLATQINHFINSLEASNPIRDFQAHMQGESDVEKFTEYLFSGRVYIYHETPINAEDTGKITEVFRIRRMSVQLLGTDYALSAWSNIQLGFAKPLPDFEINNHLVCFKGPKNQPPLAPAPPCRPAEK